MASSASGVAGILTQLNRRSALSKASPARLVRLLLRVADYLTCSAAKLSSIPDTLRTCGYTESCHGGKASYRRSPCPRSSEVFGRH